MLKKEVLIKMKKKIKNLFFEELKIISILSLFLFLFFLSHYYLESLFFIFKLTLAHLFLFILPGYFLILYYIDKISFSERLILGLGIGYGVQPLLLYIINIIIKVNILKFNWLVSFLMILAGFFLFYRRYK